MALSRRGVSGAALVLTTLLAGAKVPAAAAPVAAAAAASAAAAAGPATTAVDQIRRYALPSGPTAGLAFTARHTATDAVAPGSRLPGVRIARDGPDAAAFSGLFTDAGYAAAWLAPVGRTELDPRVSFVEDARYTNRLPNETAGESVPLAAGDSADVAAQVVPGVVLPFDRPRRAATGTLSWELAQDATRRVSARYGSTSSALDVIFVRADLVVRGGDLDARGRSVDAPPLVIDLGKIYPASVLGASQASVFLPVTAYLSGGRGAVLPQSGRAVFANYSVTGYLPESREYSLPGGAQVAEWHLPLQFTITVGQPGALAAAQTSVGMRAGGVVSSYGEHTRSATVEPGGTARIGGDGVPRAVSPTATAPAGPAPSAGVAPTAAPPLPPGPPGGPDSALVRDLAAVSGINHTLGRPVDLVTGAGRFGVTVDPDFRGEGVLALRALRRLPTGTPYADVLAVGQVRLADRSVALTRDRLVELRVQPTADFVRVTFTSGVNETPDPVSSYRRRLGRAADPGLQVEAVYDLGGGLTATMSYGVAPRGDVPGTVGVQLDVYDADGRRVAAAPVLYAEVPGAPVLYGGSERTTEFRAPLDFLLSGGGPTLAVGERSLQATTLGDAPRLGEVTVVRAGAALTDTPAPDPARPLAGGPVALYYSSPSRGTGFVAALLTLRSDGPPPQAAPPPIGQFCPASGIVDPAGDAVPPAADVVRAWLSGDPATVYATVELASLPAAGDGTATVYRYAFRDEHVGYAVQAAVDAAGAWTFEYGYFGNSGNGYGRIATITGEVVPGTPGRIRVALPRTLQLTGFAEGQLLRDTGAYTYRAGADTDRAPDASGSRYGAGPDYAVGTCGVAGAAPPPVVPEAPAPALLVLTGVGLLATWEAARRRRRARAA